MTGLTRGDWTEGGEEGKGGRERGEEGGEEGGKKGEEGKLLRTDRTTSKAL